MRRRDFLILSLPPIGKSSETHTKCTTIPLSLIGKSERLSLALFVLALSSVFSVGLSLLLMDPKVGDCFPGNHPHKSMMTIKKRKQEEEVLLFSIHFNRELNCSLLFG